MTTGVDPAKVRDSVTARRASDETTDRKFVTALARGLDVLRVFRARDGLLGNQDIAQRTGLPKPTVTRLTYTLTKLGYLDVVPGLGKYRLAPAALSLGYAALASQGIRALASPHMQVLADETGGAVALGARDRLSMVYFAQARSDRALTVQLDLGSRIPMASTAMGRAYLAAVGPSERAALFEALAERHGPDWPAMRDGIERALEGYARRGFALSLGEWQHDVHSVGVPLHPADGSGPVVFNCGAPAFYFSPERLEAEVGPRLVAMTRTIEDLLGGGSRKPAATSRQDAARSREEQDATAREEWG